MKPFINKKINISNNNLLSINKYYIISSQACFLTKKQIDSCISIVRFYLKRYKKKKNFVNLVQYNTPITKKNKGSRMGSGKGKIKEYVSRVNMNSILFVFQNVKEWRMYKIFKQMQHRLPIKIYLKF